MVPTQGIREPAQRPGFERFFNCAQSTDFTKNRPVAYQKSPRSSLYGVRTLQQRNTGETVAVAIGLLQHAAQAHGKVRDSDGSAIAPPRCLIYTLLETGQRSSPKVPGQKYLLLLHPVCEASAPAAATTAGTMWFPTGTECRLRQRLKYPMF